MMPEQRKAIQQALEALELCVQTCFDQYTHGQVMSKPEHFVNQTLTALKDALAEPPTNTAPGYCKHCKQYTIEEPLPAEQDPVANASAWFALVGGAAAELELASYSIRDKDSERVAISGAKHYRDAANALYKESKKSKAALAEPEPPRREWVGLTDEDLDVCDEDGVLLARYWERILREKNT